VILPRIPTPISLRTRRAPWRCAAGDGPRHIPPAVAWSVALRGGALRVPWPIAPGAGEACPHRRLRLALERLAPSADPRALCDALDALGLAASPSLGTAEGPGGRLLAALAVAIGACWGGRAARVIALDAGHALGPGTAERVLDCLERVAVEGHGVILGLPSSACETAAPEELLAVAGVA